MDYKKESEKDSAVNNAVYTANKKSVSSVYDRKIYEDVTALKSYKRELFKDAEFIKDPYTNQRLYQTKAEAIAKYGENFNKHLAQIDHINPLESIHEKYKNNRFLNDDDIRQIANIKENYQPLNGHMNQSKGKMTQSEYAQKHTEFSDSKTVQLLQEEYNASNAEAKLVLKKECQVAGKAFVMGAVVGGGFSVVENVKSYKNGKIDGQQAVTNIVKDTAKSATGAAAMTYVVKKGEEQILKHTAGKIIGAGCEQFVKTGGVAKAAICVTEACKSTVKYLKGNITAEEYAEELTDKGVSLASSFAIGAQGAAIGAMIGSIVLPGAGTVIGHIVGELVGNIAGYTLGSKIFQEINNYRKFLNEYNPEELRRYRELYDNVAEYTKQLREAYEIKSQLLYEHEATEINNIMLGMRDSILENNVEKMNLCIKNMCNHFGFELRFNNLQEFDEFMLSDTVEVW